MYFSLLLGMVLFMTPKHSRMLEVVLIKTKGLQCLFHPNIHSFMVQTTKYSFQGALQIPSHPHPSGCVISILISFFFFFFFKSVGWFWDKKLAFWLDNENVDGTLMAPDGFEAWLPKTSMQESLNFISIRGCYCTGLVL